jgi:ribosomal protein RSM22 (predicted rRNA methylase)
MIEVNYLLSNDWQCNFCQKTAFTRVVYATTPNSSQSVKYCRSHFEDLKEQTKVMTQEKVYRDKNGKEIKKGMILKHITGATELVLEDGAEIGFKATKHNKIFPLSNFGLYDWEIEE